MPFSLFSRPTPFVDSPSMHRANEKCVFSFFLSSFFLVYQQTNKNLILSDRNKHRHLCGKIICLIFALISYVLAFTLIIGDLFFDNESKLIKSDIISFRKRMINRKKTFNILTTI